jgi:hypothetical protein
MNDHYEIEDGAGQKLHLTDDGRVIVYGTRARAIVAESQNTLRSEARR